MSSELVKMTAQIVAAHASVKELSRQELKDEIKEIYDTLASLIGEKAAPLETEAVAAMAKEVAGPKPAVPIEESIQDEYIICLECGKKFRTLKAHLRRAHNLTPATYCERFDLNPKKYSLVSRNYSAQRRQLAKDKGLGEFRRAKKEQPA